MDDLLTFWPDIQRQSIDSMEEFEQKPDGPHASFRETYKLNHKGLVRNNSNYNYNFKYNIILIFHRFVM